MKVCTKCGKLKSLDEFYNKIDSKDGKRSDCKECNKQAKRVYYQNTAEARRNFRAQYYENNKEKVLEGMKRQYQNNKERSIKNAYLWVKNNPEKRKAIAKKYHEKNAEYFREYSKLHYERNKERIKVVHKEYKKLRMANDTEFKLACTVREKTCKAIKRGYKHKKTFELLGCTISKLKKHLESQFKEGMTWDNWGRYGWHIDHIIPIASFDLAKENEQKKCFHYTNLQPLWAEDNLRKQDMLPEEWEKCM